MAENKLLYGTTTALTMSGLATLANAASSTSATIDNTTNLFVDIEFEILVTTGAAAVATGIVEIYVKGSIDNTDFDDDSNDKWVGSVVASAAGAGAKKRIVSVSSAFGFGIPPYIQLRLRNVTGAALTAGSVAYRGIKIQTV